MRFERLHRHWWFWLLLAGLGVVPLFVFNARPPIDLERPERLLREYETRNQRGGMDDPFVRGDLYYLLNMRLSMTRHHPESSVHAQALEDLFQIAGEIRDGGWLRMRTPTSHLEDLFQKRLRTTHIEQLPMIATMGYWDHVLEELNNHFIATIPLGRTDINGYFRAAQLRRDLWHTVSLLLRKEMDEEVLERFVDILEEAIATEPTPTPDMLLNHFDEVRKMHDGEDPTRFGNLPTKEIYNIVNILDRILATDRISAFDELRERNRWINGRSVGGFHSNQGSVVAPTYWLESRVLARQLTRFLETEKELLHLLSPFPREILEAADPRDYSALFAPALYASVAPAFAPRLNADFNRVHLLGARARLYKMKNGEWPAIGDILDAEEKESAIMEYDILEIPFRDPPRSPQHVSSEDHDSIWLISLFQNWRTLRELQILPADETGLAGFTISQNTNAQSWWSDATNLRYLLHSSYVTGATVKWSDGMQEVVIDEFQDWDWALPDEAINVRIQVTGRIPPGDVAITSQLHPKLSESRTTSLYRTQNRTRQMYEGQQQERIYFVNSID
ncbi:MAG: hypothetical protein JJU11_16575 [Candidatus Sumerlaeia bacterium]|nr:hypothetical protein [Candidatus Sumerlaeia bacterium]